MEDVSWILSLFDLQIILDGFFQFSEQLSKFAVNCNFEFAQSRPLYKKSPFSRFAKLFVYSKLKKICRRFCVNSQPTAQLTSYHLQGGWSRHEIHRKRLRRNTLSSNRVWNLLLKKTVQKVHIDRQATGMDRLDVTEFLPLARLYST